ncbi:hypothetical protein Pla175_30870 [Pirellulimonas nuda]|uniref:Uncharacterized protein n=1 Tax=Pirellulimonas nuda TaxID=2528009 RepID=A0A518DE32_9BACT|nr:hypothetical protein [Pirellulimonas nuda]QDU89692.1 hypothetical protein Pla175_30870 [Pirellulimonas nuda]
MRPTADATHPTTPGRRKKWRRIAAALAVVLAVGAWGARTAILHLSAARSAYAPLAPGNYKVPAERSLPWREQSELTTQILEGWASHPLGDWKTEGKIAAPRALLARMATRRDLDAANSYLMQQEPWGNAGSTWGLHPEGDFDFTMAALVPILFLYGDQPAVLYPQARDRLLNTLLPLEGGEALEKVPRTLGLVPDTENHLLMTEGSRYLKNRWLALNGSDLAKHDNLANGLEKWLLKLIKGMQAAGLYEFNSIPYEGYTLIALLNLEAFGSQAVQSAARQLLDQLNWNYAIGSLGLRRFPPFRRQYEHADDTSLNGDRHVALMAAWTSLLPDGPSEAKLPGSRHIAIWACWAPYRLPDKTAQWLLGTPTDYFARIGHGRDGSPELYSGGPGYLLSAGGVNRGERSLLVARPITLLLDDGATDLSQLLHLAGPGGDFRHWNNTGVWKNVAVAAGPVHVPDGWQPAATTELWSVFQCSQSLCAAVHSRPDLGVVHLIESSDPDEVLASLTEHNSDAERLRHSLLTSDGAAVSYDPHAPQDLWVITHIDNQPVDRRFDTWPRLDMTTD